MGNIKQRLKGVNSMYIALAQIEFKDRTEAFGIEQGILDFGYLARGLLAHYKEALSVKMFDNRLEMQGIYYQEERAR
jgi:hypothetical protein